MPLPPDGSSPQLVLLIVQGLQYHGCTYKTRSRKAACEHVNKEHGKKRVNDEAVRLDMGIGLWTSVSRCALLYAMTHTERDDDDSGSGHRSGGGSGSPQSRRPYSLLEGSGSEGQPVATICRLDH